MTSLAGRMLATMRRRALCPPGARLIVGVSGGSDSVALTWLLVELARAGHVDLAGLAHFNHGLRGAEADRDAAFTAALADRLGLPYRAGSGDVAAVAAMRGRSLEEAAREARYNFLDDTRRQLGADFVAVGHTRDDQAETVLLRLTSGAGSRGLRGIHPRRGSVIRPAIDLRRAELASYLAARHERWVDDETNDDRARRRNRLRHVVVPALVEAEGSAVIDAIARSADIAAADELLLATLAEQAWAKVRIGAEPPVRFDPGALTAEPIALARRVVRRALEDLSGRRAGFAHVEAVRRLAASGRSGRLRVPGGQVELSAALGVLFDRGPHHKARLPPAPWQYFLPIPGELAVPEVGLRLQAAVVQGGDPDGPPTALAARFDWPQLGQALLVRGWQPGDRVRLRGGFGRKKVQDVFVDRKVPRAERHRVPIVTSTDGRIVWVAGHLIGGGFEAKPATKSVVVLSFEPLGGR